MTLQASYSTPNLDYGDNTKDLAALGEHKSHRSNPGDTDLSVVIVILGQLDLR